MRSILLATVLAASTLVTNARTADACGGSYEWQPTAHVVATPRVKDARSFALLWERLDAKRAKTVKLARMDTMSFDTSATASGRRLDSAQRLTLLGPSGTKLIAATDTVWVDLAFDRDDAREAIALPKGEWVIALDGHVKDATWTSFDVMNGSTVTKLEAGDVKISISHGTHTFTAGGLTLEGSPLGLVTVRGARYLAVAVGDSRTDVALHRL